MITSAITYFAAADWAETHFCDTRRHTGDCHHKGCRKTRDVVENLKARAMGDDLPNDLTLTDIAEWAARKSCPDMRATGFRGCSRHKWCNESAPYIVWLRSQAELELAAKAG